MNNCAGCVYKQVHKSTDPGHCYMFRNEPQGRCAQWKAPLIPLVRRDGETVKKSG